MGLLYTGMHDELLAQCRRYVANDSIAEDLLHDAFLLIFNNIGKLRSPEKGRQWMYKVVKNVCLLYVQHHQNLTQVSIDEVRETAQAPAPDMDITYSDLLNAIDQLPRGYRQVFRLSVLDGLTHRQIADLLSIEPHTSSSQLLRAKRQLRQMLRLLMLSLLVAVPLGGYYFWTSQNNDHVVTELPKVTSAEKRETANPSIDTTASSMTTTAILYGPRAKHSDISQVLANEQVQVPEDTIVDESENVPEEAVIAENATVGSGHFVTLPDVTKYPASTVTAAPTVTLALAYNGILDGTARQLPYGADGMNGEIDSVTHHHMPVTITLNGRYQLSPQWWLDGGLRYTLLSSETKVGNSYLNMKQQQSVRYLGLSFGVGHELWHLHRLSLYTTASVSYELPLHSTIETSYWQGGQLIDTENSRLTPHAQWSLGAGIGLQYNLTSAVGFFVEPSLQYYFRNSDGINTWRTDHPLTPMLPLGLRISWK